ncbi:MAG: FecR domain-containing protein [Myxococcota bacterium]|nr:FecR domain-containing protein [Myxococcota bacterium]
MHKRLAAAAGIAAIMAICGYLLIDVLLGEMDNGLEQDKVQDKSPLSHQDRPIQPLKKQKINVISVEGEVRHRKGGSHWVPIQEGDTLEMKDAIQTGDASRAVMDLGTTARVEVTPNSELTVKEISSSVSRVLIDEGRLSAVVHGKKGSKLIVEAKGSDAVAEAEKGAFSVLADGQGQMAVATQEGRVVLSAQDEQVVVTEGMQSVVEKDRPPSNPAPIPSSLFLKVKKPRAIILRKKETGISGTTSPGAMVSINGVRVLANADGSFKEQIPLKEGRNEVVVTVKDASGRSEKETFPSVTVDTKPPKAKSRVRWGNQSR